MVTCRDCKWMNPLGQEYTCNNKESEMYLDIIQPTDEACDSFELWGRHHRLENDGRVNRG